VGGAFNGNGGYAPAGAMADAAPDAGGGCLQARGLPTVSDAARYHSA